MFWFSIFSTDVLGGSVADATTPIPRPKAAIIGDGPRKIYVLSTDDPRIFHGCVIYVIR